MFIIHFLPIEHYPPVVNLLNCIKEERVLCFSTSSDKHQKLHIPNHTILRFPVLSNYKIVRLLQYFWFNFVTLLVLIWKRPKSVLYYETISAFPALLYKKFRSKVKVAVHYHEYVSPDEYRNGMALTRNLHKLEQKAYNKLDWISQTNHVRKELFCKDEGILLDKVSTMANYPSINWVRSNKSWHKGKTVKLVYVGYSVDKKSVYIEEIINWLSEQQLVTQLDIYCLQRDSFPNELQGRLGNTTVNLYPPISYKDLSATLKKYHVGLILYRCLSPNVIHCAPNKLFEYLSCGLDVWYPREMLGVRPYRSDSSPKVIEFDFNIFDRIVLNEGLISQNENPRRTIKYYAENEFAHILKKLSQ